MSKDDGTFRETLAGTYYAGPLEPARQAMRDGRSIAALRDPSGLWIVAEYRHGATVDRATFEALLASSLRYGVGATEEEAWRYLLGSKRRCPDCGWPIPTGACGRCLTTT